MAQRRLAGAARGVQNVLDLMIQDLFRQKQEERAEDRSTREREHGLSLTDSMARLRMGEETEAGLEQGLTSDITGTSQFANLLTPGGLSQELGARRELGGFPEQGPGIGEAQQGTEDRLQALLSGRQDFLDPLQQLTKVDIQDEVTGEMITKFLTPAELREDPFRTGLGAEDVGRLEGLTDVTRLLTAGPQEALQAGNVVLEQQRAASQAARESLKDDIKRAALMAEAARQPSQAQLVSSANIIPLRDAHANLVSLEDRGVGLTAGVLTIAQSPGLLQLEGFLDQFVDFVSDEQIELAQAAFQFINIVGRIFSGVAIREDEIARFLTVMIPNEADPPAAKAAKRKARELFITAATITADMAAPQAGVVMGRMFQSETLDMTMFDFTNADPEFLSGVESIIGPVPRDPLGEDVPQLQIDPATGEFIQR